MASPVPKLLRWPIWIAALATGAKSFADNRIIGSRRLNALGLHRRRVRVAATLARWRRGLLSRGVAKLDRAAFARQGYILWRDVLPPADFARMRDALLTRAWPAREMAQGHAITRRIAVDAEMLAAVPELARLLASRRWRGLMAYVAGFGGKPLYYMQTILTHRADTGASAAEEDPQTALHADAFHSSMKAWLFLTDVAEADGPLTYVPGSHRATPERLAWEHDRALRAPGELDLLSSRGSLRIGREELGALGLPGPVAFTVPANTLVVADMFGFHARGVATRPSIRVEIWAYRRRNPFLPWPWLDLGSLPGIAERRVALLWRVRDRLERRLGQPWRDVGMKRPDAP